MAINKVGSISESVSSDIETVQKVKRLAFKFGIALTLLGAILFFLTLKDVLFTEFNYVVTQPSVELKVAMGEGEENVQRDNTIFLNPNFGIYIPKISANAKIIKNVDPFDHNAYTDALQTGVAHAKTSVLPGQNGNIFLFAHSAVNFYETKKYNVFFYLLPKLKRGDIVYISYEGKPHTYEVEEVKFVNKEEIQYLGNYKSYNTLTLMTCWPAGLNLKRVIVTAKEL